MEKGSQLQLKLERIGLGRACTFSKNVYIAGRRIWVLMVSTFVPFVLALGDKKEWKGDKGAKRRPPPPVFRFGFGSHRGAVEDATFLRSSRDVMS